MVGKCLLDLVFQPFVVERSEGKVGVSVCYIGGVLEFGRVVLNRSLLLDGYEGLSSSS